jgi:hypothetical protein
MQVKHTCQIIKKEQRNKIHESYSNIYNSPIHVYINISQPFHENLPLIVMLKHSSNFTIAFIFTSSQIIPRIHTYIHTYHHLINSIIINK